MEKTFLRILSLSVFMAISSLAFAQDSTINHSDSWNGAGARACIFPSGGWTIINCSNVAAASSAALNQWGRYIMQCNDDSYFATGTAATGQMADASDGWLPAGAWLQLMTTNTVRYVSCLNKNFDSDCRILECK